MASGGMNWNGLQAAVCGVLWSEAFCGELTLGKCSKRKLFKTLFRSCSLQKIQRRKKKRQQKPPRKQKFFQDWLMCLSFLSPLILPLVYSHVLVTCTLLSNLASPLEFLSSCSPSIQLHSAYLPYPVYSMHFFLSNYHPPLPSSPESASLKAADDFPLARFNSSSSGVLRVKRMHFKSLLGVSHGVW